MNNETSTKTRRLTTYQDVKDLELYSLWVNLSDRTESEKSELIRTATWELLESTE